MSRPWTIMLGTPLMVFLSSCSESGAFSGNPQKAPPVEKKSLCPNDSCQPEKANEKDQIEEDSANKDLPEDEEDPLPKTNPMTKACRGIMAGGALLPQSSVFEAFEWDFNGDYVKGVVTYKQNGSLVTPPVYVTLSFKNRENNEFIYESKDIQSTGNKPQNLSFKCEQSRVIQKEIWNQRMASSDRTFILTKK
jgi:hypothetical protein